MRRAASVILISIDTLRADHLSAYGYTRLHTPHIDSFAQGGTLFTQAETQIPLTLPSHTALFTSTYPFEIAWKKTASAFRPAPRLPPCCERADTRPPPSLAAIFSIRRYGLDQGFDEYDCPSTKKPARPRACGKEFRRDGALVMRAARQWLDAHRGQPVFVFVHLFDLHTPYTLPPEVARRKGSPATMRNLNMLTGCWADFSRIDEERLVG